ncbi:MAG: ANTAR domain-containing protein [Jatrophihabitans sp.]
MADHSLSDLAQMFGAVQARLTAGDGRDAALAAITGLAVSWISGAEAAGVTIGRSGTFHSVGMTDDLVDQVDRIQYELRSGPCVDAAVEDACFNAGDLRSDPRWPIFGRRAHEATGVTSMLSYRLFVEEDRNLVAALNMYSTSADAFDAQSEITALVLSAVGSFAVSAATQAERARHLEMALNSNREIGIAVGVLMSLHKVTRDQSFDLLRLASQATQRKLADLAVEVIETGALPEMRVRPT